MPMPLSAYITVVRHYRTKKVTGTPTIQFEIPIPCFEVNKRLIFGAPARASSSSSWNENPLVRFERKAISPNFSNSQQS
ncbi:hypothetical protein TNCV_65271 [Trichonephila clavipes]|nr:hypothetical protein TNCV_65271 [Trichonephila clavipes]